MCSHRCLRANTIEVVVVQGKLLFQSSVETDARNKNEI